MKSNAIKAAAVAAVVILGLAACGGDSASPSPSLTADSGLGSDADRAALASITWGADADGLPLLTFDVPLSLTEGASRLVKAGDGDEIAGGDLVTFHYTITNGVDGSISASTYADGIGAQSVVLTEAELDPVFYDALVGQKVGAQIIYANLSTDPSGLTADLVPILAAISISKVSTPLARAEGTAVAPADGLPSVTLADTGAPAVAIPATDPPSDLVVQTLIEGAGSPVAEGQMIVAHYSGWLWNGTSFDSSWTLGTPAGFVLADGQLIAGWVDGLAGETVGSQVLLVIPPSLGYGDVAKGTIPAGSTLVFVVDILAAA